jgi:hypothetical protein
MPTAATTTMAKSRTAETTGLIPLMKKSRDNTPNGFYNVIYGFPYIAFPLYMVWTI